jgi:hypothetical protein
MDLDAYRRHGFYHIGGGALRMANPQNKADGTATTTLQENSKIKREGVHSKWTPSLFQ